MRMGRIYVVPLLSACAFLFSPTSAGDLSIERTVQAMGTRLEVSVSAADRETALAASEIALRAVADAERRLSTWTSESELSRLNAAPVGDAVEVSPLLARDLEQALRCSDETGGAFAPGIGALVKAWGLREGGRRPAPAELADAVAGVSAENVEIEDRRVVRRHERFIFEEGGFGKGAGLDDALAGLRDSGATSALLDLGGQVSVWNSDATVGIADPRERERVILHLQLSGGSVATSGSSERGIRVDGERLGHILDPRSGQPSGDIGSVSVVAESGAVADCLSTALYVMGSEAARRWAASRKDVGVLVVEYSDDGLVAWASPGLRDRLTAATDDVVLAHHDPGTKQQQQNELHDAVGGQR